MNIDVQAARSGAPVVFSDLGAPLAIRPDTVLVNGRPHLVTTSGAVILTEEGQAGREGRALRRQRHKPPQLRTGDKLKEE